METKKDVSAGGGCCSATGPRSSCKSVEGINSMETKKDVSAGDGCCSATGPRSSCKSVEGINSMETKKDVSAGGGCCSATGPRSSCKSVSATTCATPKSNEEKPKASRPCETTTTLVDEKAMAAPREDLTCLCCLDEMLSRPSKLVDWAEEWATLKERQSSQSSAILCSIRKCCLAVQRRCCVTSSMGTCTPSIPDPPRPSHLQESKIPARPPAGRRGDSEHKMGTTWTAGLRVLGMDCPDCTRPIRSAIDKMEDIELVSLDYLSALVIVKGSYSRLSPTVVASFLTRFTGFEVSVDENVAAAKDRMTLPLSFANPPPMETLEKLGLEAKTQPARRSSPWTYFFRRQAANEQRTIINVSFSITGNSSITPRSVLAHLEPFGPVLLPSTSGATEDRRRSEKWRASARLAAMTCLTIPILVLVWSDADQSTLRRRRWAELVLSTIVQVLAWPLFRTSLRVAWYLHSADLGLLATISTSLAWLFSVIAFSFEVAGKPFAEPFFETSALLVTLVHVGRAIQMFTRLFVGSVIEGLNDLQPADVTLVQKNAEGAEELQELESRLLYYGDVIRVLPNARVPTDGIVIAGDSAVDESMISGESIPVRKAIGSSVLAGTTNTEGILDIQVSHLVHDNSLSTIVSLVQAAQMTRSTLQDKADRVASLILPIASVSAVTSFIVWLLVNRFVRKRSWGTSVADAFTYLISVMASSCPCALALAIPFPATASIYCGAKEGVLFKHVEALTLTSKVQTMVFDKTGTLSMGTLAIVEHSYTRPDSAWIVYQLSKASKHPVSAAIAQFFESSGIPGAPLDLGEVDVVPGAGVRAYLSGFEIRGGSPRFTATLDHPSVRKCLERGLTAFTVTVGGHLLATFALSDVEKPSSKQLLEDLRKRGKHVALLSGDHTTAVQAFCRRIGLDVTDALGNCSPESKAERLQDLKKQGQRVCFIGDGVNDSVALSVADVSVSLAHGSAIAVGASGVVLRGADIRKSVLAMLQIANLFRWHSMLALLWSGLYFVFAVLLASGALVKFRITPQWAGFSEIISIGPVLLLGASLVFQRRVLRRG